MPKTSATHTNRLAHETSPYLLQHAHNPVDWYPWGAEALDRARDENKLILLSIGYSACHWCHVMERESFEDASIASLMNEHFISIKVDREERPDLDDIYMAATVAMNQGQGGWPMTVFLTPTLEPVFAGTYFPPDDQHGRPGFRRLLTNIATAWRENRDQIRQQAAHFTDQLRGLRNLGPALALGEEHLRLAGQQYAESFDAVFGGFGPAPKFPAAVSIMLLLRLHRRFGDDHLLRMATKTLDAMAQGGMYDHIGGGFARYSTDSRWLVPHFEKMLYDNALLARAYLEAFQVTEHDPYRRIATETLDYVLREMQSPDGGFYSSTDADSEGVEGKFFVWAPAEVGDVLGADDARLFNQHYDITNEGNWEGVNIPNTPRSLEETASEFKLSKEDVQRRLDTARAKMYEARHKRVKPGLDDKILTSWNGLMISALAEGYRILGDTRYLEAATNAAAFVKRELSDGDGGLLRTYRAGTAHLTAYLEDYAYLSEALIDLFEAGGDPNHLTEAVRLVDRIIERFSGDGDGAFYHTASDHERLVMRFREGHDGATPAPNAVAASALTRLSYHLARDDYRNAAIRALTAYGKQVSQIPRGFAKTLTVVDFLLEGPIELVFVGRREAPDLSALQREVAKTFLPNRIQATWDPTDARAFPESNRFRGTLGAPVPFPLLEGKAAVDGKATLYVCRNSTCEAPITDPSRVGQALARSPRSRTSTIAIRVSGRATPIGTQRYAARYEGLGFGPLGNTDLRVRRIGIGTYRADEFTEAHREALVRALMSGVNLIDTSTNYMDGGSERLIGRTLAELIDAGDIRRDEIMVVSKIGYVQGANHTVAQERENEGRGFPEMVKITDGLWHCMHPEFLEDQLARSLDRLGLETLDTCLLHNPEYFLAHGDHGTMTIEAVREEFYRRAEAAFTFFEAQVSAGRVTWYGVSSNTAGFSEQDTEATSLTRLLAAAERAGGPSHHFRFLQVPMNLLETDPVFVKKDGPDAARTVLEAAAAAGVAVLTNRPLNAIARDHIVRLASVGVEEVEVDFDQQMESVRELERAFEDRLAPGIHVSGGSLEPRQFFHWGTALGSVDVQALGIDQWEQVESQVRHSVGRITTILDQRLAGDTGRRWSDWHARYTRELDLLLNGFRRRIARRMSDENAVFEAAIDPLLPENRRHEPLARKALWVVASTPGVSCVLNGMRTTAYVRDAIAVAEWDTLPDVVRVYEAVARALERK